MSEIIGKLWERRPFRQAGGSDNDKEAALAGREEALSEEDEQPGDQAPGRLINKELSDLQFIKRVLEEAHNPRNPLLERLRFLGISGAVLDQFYSVRVAKMKRSAMKLDAYITPDGLTPATQLNLVLARGRKLMQAQQDTWAELRDNLAEAGIHLIDPQVIDARDAVWLRQFFTGKVLPLLTPCTVDEEHPFPFIPSGGISTVLEFDDKHILIPLPANLPRFINLPGEKTRLILLEHLIYLCWSDLLPATGLTGFGVFQLIRDNDLAREERSQDLRAMVESGLKLRHKANPILLKVNGAMSKSAQDFIVENLSLSDEISIKDFVQIVPLPGLSALTDLITSEVAAKFPQLLFPSFESRMPIHWQDTENVFDIIKSGDQLFHWPYDSFQTVITFLRQAANDPDVLSIKQTLYRTSDNSPVVDALIDAAHHGKSVTTIIELEAREDESTNVELAKRLEQAGAQVFYGIIGLKVHCKATLVVRREDDDVVLYSHLATGNYHAGNAKRYTDLSLFTRDQVIGRDVNLVFNYMTSGAMLKPEKLLVSPFSFRPWLADQIRNEIEHARAGKDARIVIKVNSFTDPLITELLYEASAAGVQVDLIVRRHCILRPGVPGLSENVRVKSLVGRFLEHARIFVFSNGTPLDSDQIQVYVGSADLMPRNLDERVEIVFPVSEPVLRHKIVHEILHANVCDTSQTWVLKPDNEFHRHPGVEGPSAQEIFIRDEAGELGKLNSKIDTGDGATSS